MESTVIKTDRLKEKNKWVYSAHSQHSLQIENFLKITHLEVKPLGSLKEEIADGLHGIRRYVDEGVVLLAVGNITEYGLDLTEKRNITLEEHKRLKRSQVQYGDLLVTITGRLGTALVYELKDPANLSAHVARIKLKPNSINPYYLAAYLNSPIGQQLIDEFSVGSIYPHINVNRLQNVRVILPPRPIQDQVAHIMQDAYGKRRAELLRVKEVIGDVSNDVLTTLGVDSSLIRHEKSFVAKVTDLTDKWRVENNDVRSLGDALKSGSYEVVKIGDLATMVQSRTKPNKRFRYIEIGSIDTVSGVINVERLTTYDVDAAPNNAQREVKRGDVLVSTRRPTRGALAVVPDNLDGEMCTVFFSVVRIKKGVPILPEYIVIFLRTVIGQIQFQQAITETTYPVISDSDVVNLLLPLPPLRVQRQIIAEVTKRLSAAQRIRADTASIVTKAKSRIEQMILGKELSA